MPLERPSSSDRRGDDGLTFDAEQGILVMGTYQSNLRPAAGNRAVLEAFVDLAGRCRGDRVSEMVEVRQDDVDALARALDLDSDDLTAQMESVLGASREEAVRLVAKLKEYRLIGGLAAAATGAAVVGAFVVGSANVSMTETHTPVVARPAAKVAMRAHPQPIVETPEGVGLIPPITAEADGTALIPPANVDVEPESDTKLIPPATVDHDPSAPAD